MTVLSTAEAMAVSICVVSRLFDPEAARTPFETKSQRFHPGKCRWCERAKDELIERLREWGVHMIREGATMPPEAVTQSTEARLALDAWRELPRNTRWARLREAQEASWYDQL